MDAAVDPRVEAFLAERRLAPEIVPLSGDASTRRYLRLREGSETSVLALYPEPFQSGASPFVVVRHLLAGYGLPVPAIREEDGPRGIVLLEDLGDQTLQQALGAVGPGERVELYRDAASAVARLQLEAARGPQRAVCFQVAFDIEKLAWELHYFVKHFVEGLRGRELSVEDRATLSEAIHRLSEEIASWPRVLCHRDFHSRNLMLHSDALFWIDFQDARMGPSTYDLVSLLRDSYVELPDEFAAERGEEFRRQALPGEARETFARRFDLMSVQRNLKALGTFGFMKSVRGNDVYLPYIPRTLAHARRNLARYPELSALRRVLARHVEELS
ncbi:MAG TPA: phosphotransferase [Vicinamibacteria bacterium]|nr:phosphotransferase [Vicinamibacteria bacterium]